MNVSYLPVSIAKASNTLINYQSVRYLRPRKPFWLGIAKSKIDKVPEPKVFRNSEENEEYRRITYLYNKEIKSIRNFLQKTDPLLSSHVAKENEIPEQTANLKKLIEASIQKNEAFNAKSAEFREERIKETLEKYTEEAVKEIQKIEEAKSRKQKLIEEAVKLEKIKSASFITPENLDEAIEKCLSTEVDYNYAIDIHGNKYEGKETLSEEESNEYKAEVGF